MTNKETLAAIAAWQACGTVHPLTCGKDSNHENLIGVEIDGKVTLKCPSCDYTQTYIPPCLEHAPAAFPPEIAAEFKRVAENYRAEDDEPKHTQEFPGDPYRCVVCGSHEWVDDDPMLCAQCVATEPLKKRITELEQKYAKLSKLVQDACMNNQDGPVPYAAFGHFDDEGPDEIFVPPTKLPNLFDLQEALKGIVKDAAKISDSDTTIENHTCSRVIESLAQTALGEFPVD